MLNKKNILTYFLVAGLSLVPVLTSFNVDANESENRYEKFSGDYITVNENTQSGLLDFEVKGNTFYNIIPKEADFIPSQWTYNNGVGNIKFADESTSFIGIRYDTSKPIVVNKEYTMYINVTKNTLKASGNNVVKVSLSKDFGDEQVKYIV